MSIKRYKNCGSIISAPTETIAFGEGSHTEGYRTTASGSYSHTEGNWTVAKGDYQTIVGKFNATSSLLNNAQFIVGNGTANNTRSNSFVVSGSQVGINITPSSSIALHIDSTTKGFRMPVMTYAQKIAINPKYPGLEVYQTGSVTQTSFITRKLGGLIITVPITTTIPEGPYMVQPSGSAGLVWVAK